MELKYCRKCHERKLIGNFKKQVTLLEEVNDIEVIEGCISYCGPGRLEYACMIDEEIISAKNFEDLLVLVKEQYDN